MPTGKPCPQAQDYIRKDIARLVKQLYRAIFEQATKTAMLVQRCNAVGHLSVGFMQINRTGTPLFFSARPGSLTAAQEDQLRQGLAMASTGGAHAIPPDWLVNDCPEIWTDNASTR